MTGKMLFKELGKEEFDVKNAAVKIKLPSGEIWKVASVEFDAEENVVWLVGEDVEAGDAV